LPAEDVQDEQRDPREERDRERGEDDPLGAALGGGVEGPGHVGVVPVPESPPPAGVGTSSSSSPRRLPAKRAINTSRVRPTAPATKPPARGPAPPIGAPPGDGDDRMKVMYAM